MSAVYLIEGLVAFLIALILVSKAVGWVQSWLEAREQERLDCLRAAFARMSVSDLRLLWAYSKGASIRELARRQGVSYRAMVTRLSRARCCLRTALHKAGCKSMPDVEALGDRILVSPSAFPRQCPHGPVAPHRSRRYRSK